MHTTDRPNDRRAHGHRVRKLVTRRRAVVSVLSMMFLILFGSLVGAMAVASQGNIKAASTHMHVMRAMGAAETGLAVAEQRLMEAASRFVISHSRMDAAAVTALWTGNLAALDGDKQVLPPPSGHAEVSPPTGIAEAVALIHAADQNIYAHDSLATPVVTAAPAGTDITVYKADGWVVTPCVSLATTAAQHDRGAGFQIVYAPLANGTDIRAIVYGYDFAYRRNGQPLKRIITKDFSLSKRVAHAVISPNRIMVGKNVHIVGDLGARYSQLAFTNGTPLIVRSDFLGIDPDLDDKLMDFYDGVEQYDVDGDNRLRIEHPVEKQGIPGGGPSTYGGPTTNSPFADVTKDGYLDELDIFINHYDANGDGKVALHDELRAGGPYETSLSAEFVDSSGNHIDRDLAILLDSVEPDRNRNGRFRFTDLNGDGIWNPATEAHDDYDAALDVVFDQELGYRDGVIDRMDRYSKIRGSLAFVVSAADWAAQHGDWTESIRGAIRPDFGEPPVLFARSDTDLPPINRSRFISAENEFRAAADGVEFWQQVADQLGVSTGNLATYVESNPRGTGVPRYERLDPDLNFDGLPDNFATAYYERMPFNSPAFSDWYYRPVFEGMRFRDVVIPRGLNALFINCEFIGVTYIQSETNNTHRLWTLYGKMEFDPALGAPAPAFARTVYGDDVGEDGADAPPMLPATAIPPAQNILLAVSAMDKGDVLNSQIASYDPAEYALLLDPLVINGLRVVDTKQHSNNIRFHDCLFVGSLVSDNPLEYTHVRNKLQFTGTSRFATEHPDDPTDALLNPEPADRALIATSSLMLPNYSVDIGHFNSPAAQNVQLRGAIIAGVLDVRGNANIEGALLLTFEPTPGSGPLVDATGNPIGNPAGFNCSLGYFGPDDGDGEAIDPETLPPMPGSVPGRLAGWDTNGDGLADVSPFDAQPAGSTAVPFHGYGRIFVRFDPDMTLPSGIMLPLTAVSNADSYREGTTQ